MSPPLDGSKFKRPGDFASPMMAQLLRLQALSLRWQLEQEALKGPVTSEVLDRLSIRPQRYDVPGQRTLVVPRPSGQWIKVPIAVAAAFAEARMPADELAKFNEWRNNIVPGLQQNARGDRNRREVERQVETNRAVFLTRFWPVPKPGEWHPGSWTQAQYRAIESQIRDALREISPPSEPAWWPDGWRDALESEGT